MRWRLLVVRFVYTEKRMITNIKYNLSSYFYDAQDIHTLSNSTNQTEYFLLTLSINNVNYNITLQLNTTNAFTTSIFGRSQTYLN